MKTYPATVVYIGLLLFLFCLPQLSFSQLVENVNISIRSNQNGTTGYSIYYDLVAPYNNIPSQIKVKLTMPDGSFIYLRELTGDVGNLIYPGRKREIIWDHVKELVHFNSSITLTVEAIPSIQLPEKTKRHKPVSVSLTPVYEPNKKYAIKLFRSGVEVVHLSDVILTENKFQVQLPRKTKLKGKYQLAITDGNTTYFSNTFKVKPKISPKWLLLPAIAIPTYILVNQYIESNEPLPGPPSGQ